MKGGSVSFKISQGNFVILKYWIEAELSPQTRLRIPCPE